MQRQSGDIIKRVRERAAEAKARQARRIFDELYSATGGPSISAAKYWEVPTGQTGKRLSKSGKLRSLFSRWAG